MPTFTPQARAGATARNAALKTMLETHQDDWERLLISERVLRGLPPLPTGRTAEEIQKSIARAEKQLTRWRAQIGAMTNGH